MMKKALIILLLISNFTFGQFGIGIDYNCGTWQYEETTYSDWETIDTVSFNENGSENWIYDEIKTAIPSGYTTLEFCPCGKNPSYEQYQKRINGKGIIQKQTQYVKYEYIPKPKSDFELAIDSLMELGGIKIGESYNLTDTVKFGEYEIFSIDTIIFEGSHIIWAN